MTPVDRRLYSIFAFFVVAAMVVFGYVGYKFDTPPKQKPTAVSLPAAPDPKYLAALEVAGVFGRAPGCANASHELITAVANESVKMKLDARTFAALIAVESGCNQYATSTRGAIGLTMVVPRVWKGSYDFETTYNLLNRTDNLHVGASILSGMITQYGPALGLRHYNGMNIESTSFDADYTSKILSLAGRK